MQKITDRNSIILALHGPLDPVVQELITAAIAGLDGYDDAPDEMLRVLIVEPGDTLSCHSVRSFALSRSPIALAGGRGATAKLRLTANAHPSADESPGFSSP